MTTYNEKALKAAGQKLMEKIPHLYWIACATHYSDLCLEVIICISPINIRSINKLKKKKNCPFIAIHKKIHNLYMVNTICLTITHYLKVVKGILSTILLPSIFEYIWPIYKWLSSTTPPIINELPRPLLSTIKWWIF